MNHRILLPSVLLAAIGAFAITAPRLWTCSSPSAQAAPAELRQDTLLLATLAFAQQSDIAPQQQRGRRATGELIDRCLDVAREIDPELGKQLAQKRQQNPEEFEQTMQQGEVGRGLLSMVQLKQRDPDLYRAKINEVAHSLQINRVAFQLQQAMQGNDTGRIKALQEQLRSLLQIQLALSLKSRCEYLQRIEEQVQQLRQEIDHDAANFQALVDARMQAILSQPVQNDPTAVIPAAARNGGEQRQPAANGATQRR